MPPSKSFARRPMKACGLSVCKFRNPRSKKSHGFSIARGSGKKLHPKFLKTSSLAKNHSNSSKTFGSKAQNSSAIFIVEIVPGRAEHPKKFRALGLTSITQNSRERFLLPLNESEAAQLLQNLLSQFPPADGKYKSDQFIDKKSLEENEVVQTQTVGAEVPPIDVREWLIEPDAEELARISLRDSPIG